jgi:phosphate transport system substrate-binding protein
VRKDPLAIGFNNLNFAYDLKTGQPVRGIRVIPIDINGNHNIDPEESFYASLQDTAKAIADGKYPSPPARALHLVAHGRPAKKEVVDFLRWVLTDGQKFVMEAGYINLPDEKLKEDLKKLE